MAAGFTEKEERETLFRPVTDKVFRMEIFPWRYPAFKVVNIKI